VNTGRRWILLNFFNWMRVAGIGFAASAWSEVDCEVTARYAIEVWNFFAMGVAGSEIAGFSKSGIQSSSQFTIYHNEQIRITTS
jgi:hypothetical protein